MNEREFRSKKDKKETLSASLPTATVLRLNEFCLKNRFYKSEIIEVAIEDYLDKFLVVEKKRK